jgi:hypothetical protein
VKWNWLSGNPSAIHLLETNPNKINWDQLSRNPSAIHILEANLDKVKWIVLAMNPGAIRMLNANIFTYDYDAMKSSRDALAEDLMKERFHPKHIDQFESWGFD